jgi:hypothetical protein
MISGPFVVSFIGPSGVGKTTSSRSSAPAPTGCAGTVKHATRPRRGRQARLRLGAIVLPGAEAVLLAGASSTVLFLDPGTHHPTGRHHSPADDRQRSPGWVSSSALTSLTSMS